MSWSLPVLLILPSFSDPYAFPSKASFSNDAHEALVQVTIKEQHVIN